MKKRMMSILLLATMVTGLIAGCGSTKKEAKNDDDVVTVTWMTSRPVDGEIDQVMHEIADQYSKEKGGKWKIEFETTADRPSYLQKLKTLIAGGNMPDIIDIDADPYCQELVDAGMLVDVKQFLKDNEGVTIPEIEASIKDNISIEEMYQLTGGTVEYGKVNSIVKNMFYLSKARQNAIKLSEILSKVLGNDSKFEDVIEYIKENGLRIEPEIISRQSEKGIKLSESVNLDLTKDEQILVDEIKRLSLEELENILQNGGFTNVKDVTSKVYGNQNKQIDKSRYYAEAIIAQYDWSQIGIEEFKISERNELIKSIKFL